MNARSGAVGLQVDRRVARLVALWVVFGMATFLLAGLWWIPAVLAVDFLLRGLGRSGLSPLAFLGRRVASMLRWAPQPQWGAPKVFAARLGCLFCLIILASDLAGAVAVAKGLGACLLLLASLEAFLGTCVACRIHSLVYRVTEATEISRRSRD
jgi:hypothetical protein